MTAVFAVVAVGMIFAGCKKAEPPSPIMKKVQDAGAGEVTNGSKESIEQWLRQHADVAKEIRQDCARVKPSRPADWANTTEGRVCEAAASVAVFGHEHVPADDRKF
jgi:hypothetical protein